MDLKAARKQRPAPPDMEWDSVIEVENPVARGLQPFVP